MKNYEQIEMSAQNTPAAEAHVEAQAEISDKEMEEMIKSLKPFLETLGGRKINISTVSKKEGGTMSFSHETNTVTVNLNFLRERGLSRDQIAFGLSHEMGHLIQLCADPEGYLKSFKVAEKRAEEKAQSPEERRILEQVYHNFFNVVLDVNDNQIITEQLVPYHPGEGRKADVPPKVYDEKLFPADPGKEIPDYSDKPLYSQFLNYLLRKNMTGKESNLASEVREILQRKIPVFGREFTVEEFIKKWIQPSSRNVSQIVGFSEQNLLPLLDELVAIDRQKGNLKPQEMPELGDGATSDGKKKIAEKVIEDQKEDGKSMGERLMDLARKNIEKFLAEKRFNEKEIKDLADIQQACEKETAALASFWHSFMRVITEIKMEKERRHKAGLKINVPDLIMQWPRLMVRPEAVEAMEGNIPVAVEQLLPKNIKLVLCLDMSGSMDDEKRLELKKNAYMLAMSLKRFQTEVALRYGEGSPQTQTNFIGFGTESLELPAQKSGDDDADFYRAILEISASLGGTEDDKALLLAEEKFSEDDLRSIKKGETVAIVLEITDGETATAQNSTQIVGRLNGKGIFCRGIQIPGGILKEEFTEEEKRQAAEQGRPAHELVPPTGTFAEVWKKWGLQIIDIRRLRSVLEKLLEEAMERA